MSPNDNGQVSDFLNPKSMLTPGMAGGIAMMIATAFWNQFDIPPRWTDLIVSFVLGLLIFSAVRTMPTWERLVLYLVNSLIIFTVSMGTGYTAYLAARPNVPQGGGTASLSLTSVAYAQALTPPQPTVTPTPPTPPKLIFPLP